jgi:hypothetical protein
VDALLLAEIDNFLLGQRRVVLDLVDRGDDSGVREELLEVAFAVLNGRLLGVDSRKGKGWTGLTLETPMALVLPVATSFSICFHVSTWLWDRMMSRSPFGSLGNLSSLPGRDQQTIQGRLNRYTHTLRVHQQRPVLSFHVSFSPLEPGQPPPYHQTMERRHTTKYRST